MINKVCLLLLCLLLLSTPQTILAATMSISPATGVYSVGATFSVQILVNTSGKPVNAAEGTLKFNPQELSVVSVSRASSIFNLWVAEPTFSNSAGTISFSGGLPSGYTGAAGNIFNVTFRAKSATAAKVSLTGGSVLANDGMGTNVLTSMSGGTYTISAPSSNPEPEVVEYVAPANTPAAPKITSLTHPDSSKWYQEKTAKLAWSLPSDIEAVRTLLDTNPTTVPTKVYDTPISDITITDLPEGVSYFHMQFKNADGWGRVTHYRLAIDSVKPTEFTITQSPEADMSSPVQTLILQVKDDSSGVERYMVRVDNNEAYEFIDKDKTGLLVLPELVPGYHTVTIEAFDASNNSLVSNYSFTTLAFDRPLFTDVPNEINDQVIPVLRGQTRPGATVDVTVTKIGAEPVSYQVVADESGTFTFIPSGTFSTGVYEISAKATDIHGAISEMSDVVKMAVQQPGFVRVGSYLVDILSIVVPLLAMTVGLFFLFWFVVLRYRRFRQKIGAESSEVVAVVRTRFAAAKEVVSTRRKTVAESRKTNKLTKSEEDIFTEMDRLLAETEKAIEKEVMDVEGLLTKK